MGSIYLNATSQFVCVCVCVFANMQRYVCAVNIKDTRVRGVGWGVLTPAAFHPNALGWDTLTHSPNPLTLFIIAFNPIDVLKVGGRRKRL